MSNEAYITGSYEFVRVKAGQAIVNGELLDIKEDFEIPKTSFANGNNYVFIFSSNKVFGKNWGYRVGTSSAESFNELRILKVVMTSSVLTSVSSENTDKGIIGTSDISDQAVTLSKITSGTSGQLIVANSSGVPTYVAMSGDASISNSGVVTVPAIVPTGSVTGYAGSSAPSGWLLCDGSQQPVSTYPALDAILGTTYGSRTNGSGDAGSTHFRLPDLRGRVVAGRDNMGGTAASRLTSTVLSASNALGATGGAQTHILTSSQIPAHSHGIDYFYRTTFAGGGSLNGTNLEATGTVGTTRDNTGGGNAHTNTQPTIVLNYIIKA